MWRASVLTLFPKMFPGVLGHSLVGQALQQKLWDLKPIQIRDYAKDKHQTVDDRPFGGGAGMVMKPDVLAVAIDDLPKPKPLLIYLSPRGRVFNQQIASELIQVPHVAFICGRYEGVDERVLEAYNIQELSIGDYILSGGEIPAMAVIDTCVRLLPTVLGNDETLHQESFCGKYTGLLEYPHYTRPSLWQGRHVPEILLSGNHQEIEKWRLERAKEITRQRRPDLGRPDLLMKE